MPWLSPLSNPLGGHFWTLRPYLSRRYLAQRFAWPFASVRGAGPPEPPRVWEGEINDAPWGVVRLSGLLHAPEGAKSLLIIVHGLGGHAESFYLEPAVWEAAVRGWACLRLNMRGADCSGEDFYHAALTADLHVALASPELTDFDAIYVLGYSLGGHIALRLATEALDTRVRSVASVCAPIDLARSAWAIDRPASFPYRQYVLGHLKATYVPVARRRSLTTPPLEQVLRARTLRTWDQSTVIPRFGFADPDDYYGRASAAGRLNELRVPALLVNTEHDPMVPAATVRPALIGGAAKLDVRWLRSGGHVGFPLDLDLGEPGPHGLEPQILSWLENAKY